MRQLTNENWGEFSSRVAMPAQPTDWSPAAMERLMVYLKDYIVDVRGVHSKYHARNKVELIEFSTPEEQRQYILAWEKYLEALAKLEGSTDIPGGKFLILVQFLKFRQAAELIRAPYLARRLYNIVYKKERSAVCACNFKETIAKITSILVNDYNVPRNEISLIWGGMLSTITKKRKKQTKADKEIAKFIAEKFSDADKEFLEELGIFDDDVCNVDQEGGSKILELSAAEAEEENSRAKLQLGKQSPIQRQQNIDRFQRDQSKFCMFTFKSGGVGLSLHQETETNRVRETLLAPTYSAIELVQGMGRAHRITSCSDTDQTIVFYRGTIEERVAARVSQKMKCLRKVVRQKESWESVILGNVDSEDETTVSAIQRTGSVEVVDENNDLISENEEESDED